MPVQPIPEEVLAAQQAETLAQATVNYPPPGNVPAATTYHDRGAIVYRGTRYRVRTCPWPTGARLALLRMEYRALVAVDEPNAQVADQMLRVLQATVDLMDSLVERPWWRLRKRSRPGHGIFQDAEQGEIEGLLDFFSPARTKYPVFVRASLTAPPWLLPTIGTPSFFSPVGIHAWWRRTVIPVAGVTSRMA